MKTFIALALLMMIASLSATSVVLGYGFTDLRNVSNQSILGLGVAPRPSSILCGNVISFSSGMVVSGTIIPYTYLNMYYNATDHTPYAACYKNYTCELTHLSGVVANTISSSNQASVFLNITNITSLMTYNARCYVYDKIGGSNMTEQRLLSFTTVIIPPTPPQNYTSVEYTNGTTITIYGLATIPPFMGPSGSSSTSLGLFIGFCCLLLGMYACFHFGRVFIEWH
jgi:hypothetical protein